MAMMAPGKTASIQYFQPLRLEKLPSRSCSTNWLASGPKSVTVSKKVRERTTLPCTASDCALFRGSRKNLGKLPTRGKPLTRGMVL